jgi:hypothetical protein
MFHEIPYFLVSEEPKWPHETKPGYFVWKFEHSIIGTWKAGKSEARKNYGAYFPGNLVLHE